MAHSSRSGKRVCPVSAPILLASALNSATMNLRELGRASPLGFRKCSAGVSPAPPPAPPKLGSNVASPWMESQAWGYKNPSTSSVPPACTKATALRATAHTYACSRPAPGPRTFPGGPHSSTASTSMAVSSSLGYWIGNTASTLRP